MGREIIVDICHIKVSYYDYAGVRSKLSAFTDLGTQDQKKYLGVIFDVELRKNSRNVDSI